MKKNSLLLLATAVLLAAGVAILVRTLLAPPKVAVAKPVTVEQPAGEVLVATKALQPGDFIDSSQLVWKPTKEKPSRSLYFVRGQDHMEALYGATVRETVNAGESIRTSKIVRRGEPGFLAAVLNPGMRAVSIPTSRVESNFGLVSPGDRVDVILGLQRERQAPSSSTENAPPFLASQTILRDVRVLALNNLTGTDQAVREDDEPANKKDAAKAATKPVVNFETVTLEVDPRQAEKLAVAKEIGTLQLALRPVRESDGDMQVPLEEPPVTTLGGTTAVYANNTPPAGPPKVVAFRGTKREVIGQTQP